MAPHYVPLPPYATAPITTLLAPHPPHHQQHQQHQHHQQQQHQHQQQHHQPHPHQHQQLHQSNPFAFSHYHTSNTTNVIAPFSANTYIQTRPSLSCHIPSDCNVVRGIPFCRPPRSGFIIDDHHNPSPPTKQEPGWTPPSETSNFPPPAPAPTPSAQPIKTSPSSSRCATEEASFGTDVDTLMKAIQSKAMTSTQSQATNHIAKMGSGVGSPLTLSLPIKPYHIGESSSSKLTYSGLQEEALHPKANKKRYQCTIEGCTKSFFQKTHLDIHERAHTGVKPYSCKQPGCDRTFSQLGNLKTHERRHTGERPYQCETCGKRFAQRGNVRAHKIVHDQSKPYICKLDDCGKQFTQLGNLKSHQNKFHITTLRALTTKFASIQEGDTVHAADRELWEYFANLYKNSNKGIKGRGKDRKVGTSLMMSSMRNVGVSRSEGYGMSGPGRGNMVVNLNVNAAAHPMGRANNGNGYNVYDDVVSSSGSGGASSVSTCYEDAPSDTFDETGRTGEMSFGEQRIY